MKTKSNSKADLLDTISAETLNSLNGMFDSVKEEKLDEETMERLCAKVASSEKDLSLDPDDHFEKPSPKSAQKEHQQPHKDHGQLHRDHYQPHKDHRDHFRKKYIAILVMAACGAVIVSSAYMYEKYLYRNANNSPVVTDDSGMKTVSKSTTKPFSVTDDASAGEIFAESFKIVPVVDITDKISEAQEKLIGYSANLTDRFGYYGLRFFDTGNETLMCKNECRYLYKYNGNSFLDTGIRSYETLLFASDPYEGYSYIPFVPPACPGDFAESGLLRINLKTQEVEKYIDSPLHTNSVTIAGSKVYYSGYDGSAQLKDKRKHYYLKCADLETGEITALISDAPYTILNLNYYNGSLYFITESNNDDDNSVTEADRAFNLCRMDSDMVLHSLPANNLFDYTVADNRIYLFCIDRIYEPGKEKCLREINHVYKYDADGNKLGETSSVIESSEWLAGTVLESHHLFLSSGNNSDRSLTIYDGKLVEYDISGVYLRNLEDDTFEKIIDINRDIWDGTNCFSTTVYDGKLFAASLSSTIYEYDGNEVKTYELPTES